MKVRCRFCEKEFEKVKDYVIHMRDNHKVGKVNYEYPIVVKPK